MNALKKLRMEKQMTQAELAVTAKVALGTIQRIESGKIDATAVGSIRKICSALGCTLSNFFALGD